MARTPSTPHLDSQILTTTLVHIPCFQALQPSQILNLSVGTTHQSSYEETASTLWSRVSTFSCSSLCVVMPPHHSFSTFQTETTAFPRYCWERCLSNEDAIRNIHGQIVSLGAGIQSSLSRGQTGLMCRRPEVTRWLTILKMQGQRPWRASQIQLFRSF